jgi:hypothetical protein
MQYTTRRLSTIAVTLALIVTTLTAWAENGEFSWKVRGQKQGDTALATQILLRRLESLKPELSATINSKVENDILKVSVAGWEPTSKQIGYLTTTRGVFRVVLNGEPLITESDILDARPSITRAGELAVRLTDVAAERIAIQTKDALGKIAVVVWEGSVISQLRIGGQLGRDIGLGINAPDEEIRLMSAVLRSGRLPEGTSFQRIVTSNNRESTVPGDKLKAIESQPAESIAFNSRRPKKTFISPSTREVGHAMYYDSVRRQIEEFGTRNFPSADGKRLYGLVIISIPIYHDGSIYEKEGGPVVDKSSGNERLDASALAIARNAGPFERFSKQLRTPDRDDVWVLTAPFNFTRVDDDQLEVPPDARRNGK